MNDAQRLTFIRTVHTVIYLIMAAASFALLYAGLTGARGVWLWWCGGLVAGEAAVFTANGLKCPLTAIAVKTDPPSGASAIPSCPNA
jgi:hypothetical protein